MRFFFDDPFAVAEYARKADPELCALIIASAEDSAEDRFKFDMPWDLERTAEYVAFDGEIDWLRQPGDDPEWVYAFNRCRFWATMGQAYALTRDEKFPEAIVRQMSGWIAGVRRADPAAAPAWRTLDVGLRLGYWIRAFECVKSSEAVTPEACALFEDSVGEQADFLMENAWNDFHLMSNWGVLANHGLFMAGLFLSNSVYADEALSRLAKNIEIQVYRDGQQWEQSPTYHNEVASLFLDVITLADRNKVSVPETIRRKTRDMLRAALFSAKPDHRNILMGDSDEVDVRGLLTRGAYVFADQTLRFGGLARPDFEAAWDLGEEGMAAYEALPSVPPARADKWFPDGGNLYFRSDWSGDAAFVHFANATLGAGHGHADKLHVDISAFGEDILTDAGRMTYVFGKDRVSFKEMKAHNTVVADGKELYTLKDSWECDNLAHGTPTRFFSDARYGYGDGGHAGYFDRGIYLRRRVVFIKPDIVVICDGFYASGGHKYNQYFHFGATGELAGEDSAFVFDGRSVRADVRFHASELSAKVIDSRVSPHYNLSVPNKAVETTVKAGGFGSAYAFFALSPAGKRKALNVEKLPVHSTFKGIRFADASVEAFSVVFGERHYTLVFAHKEYASPTDTFKTDGCVGFGQTVVFDRLAGETSIGTVLNW
ncbi:MAG: heparinase II/III family protein [Clostridiales bacterium]|jgi:hypothetical protein|nr:heparinase II/III family protein [Clostridiales bacterium]